MSTSKKLIIIALVFFLLAIGVAYYLIFIQSPTATIENPPTSSFFPIDTEPGNRPVGNGGIDPVKSQFTNGQPRLLKISADPVSGITAFREGTSTTLIRYTDKTTSHITDVNPVTGEAAKMTNTTLSGIYEALWSASPTRLVLRFLAADKETIHTYTAAIVSPKATTSLDAMRQLQVTYLPENISTIAISPNGQRIFSLVGSSEGGKGIITNADGSKPLEMFNSPIREWIATWPQENTIVLTTKASSRVNGAAYAANTKGEMRRLIGDVPGLTTLVNPDVTLMAYANGDGELHIRNLKTNTDIKPAVNTLPEKCVWSKRDVTILYCAGPASMGREQYPDVWYKGQITFNDDIYKIETKTNQVFLIGQLQDEFEQAIDATHLTLSPSDEYLMFINKKDYTGWSLKVSP